MVSCMHLITVGSTRNAFGIKHRSKVATVVLHNVEDKTYNFPLQVIHRI